MNRADKGSALPRPLPLNLFIGKQEGEEFLRFINPEQQRLFHPFKLLEDGTELDDLEFSVRYEEPFGFASERMYAISAWVCLTRILLLAFNRRKKGGQTKIHEKEWQSESIYFHDMLSHIRGHVREEDIQKRDSSWERVVQCDACLFIDALDSLVRNNVVEGYDNELRTTCGKSRADVEARLNFDFASVFAIPFDESNPTAAALLKPLDWVFLKESVRDAYQRITWLRSVIDSSSKKSSPRKTTRSRRGAPSAYTVKEKEGILRDWKWAQQNGEKQQSFLSRVAQKHGKPIEEVKRLFWAASQWSRRK